MDPNEKSVYLVDFRVPGDAEFRSDHPEESESPPPPIEDEKLEANNSEEFNHHDIPQNSWLKSKWRIIKNLLVIGLAWMFLFTAYQSVANLQSSLNSDAGLGTASLSAIYVTLVFSCLFVPPFMISNIGLKWTIVISQVCYLLYIGANMYARWYTLMPAAIILGLGAAPLWTAKCTYLTELAGFYSKISGEENEIVVNRFFGIFFGMFQTTQIWGNIASSTILKADTNGTNETFNYNCGAGDCPKATSSIAKPIQSSVYMLCGIYLGLGLLGILAISIFLNDYTRNKKEKRTGSNQFSLVISTIKHLKKKEQILIIPITCWLGFSQGFMGADFTKSFVSCSKGVNYVGLTMICFGVVDTIASYFFGFISKYIGRIPCFVIPSVINYAMIILMIFWKPVPDQIYMLFIIPALWGIADAAWQTQLNSIYGVLFPKTQEAAFSNFRLWESFAFAVAYAYSSSLCTSTKLYLLLGYLTLGVLGYGAIEVIQFIEKVKSRSAVSDNQNEKKVEAMKVEENFDKKEKF